MYVYTIILHVRIYGMCPYTIPPPLKWVYSEVLLQCQSLNWTSDINGTCFFWMYWWVFRQFMILCQLIVSLWMLELAIWYEYFCVITKFRKLLSSMSSVTLHAVSVSSYNVCLNLSNLHGQRGVSASSVFGMCVLILCSIINWAGDKLENGS